MKNVFKSVLGLIVLIVITISAASVIVLEYNKAKASTEEIDAKLVSVYVNGAEYIHGASAPVQLKTDEIFTFKVTMMNTGATAWGQNEDERGASLLSYPDYDSVFGTFFITPSQGTQTLPGNTFTWVGENGTRLRAPCEAGHYTMKWRLADWPVGTSPGNGSTAYNNRHFYGDVVTVDVVVDTRAEQPPEQRPRTRGVLDINDFEYEGSFLLPRVTPLPDGKNDEKNFNASGVTMRTVEVEPGVFEKRMIMHTGTFGDVLYECAIPELGRFVNNSGAGVPTAPLRTVFGVLPRLDRFGTIWYDEQNDSLFWTNFNSYYTPDTPGFPVLCSASLAGGEITQTGQWHLPYDLGGAPYKAFWGGVTVLPDSFAWKYTDGRKLALGFGGEYSINASSSFGPAIAAVSVGESNTTMDVLPIMYYGGGAGSWTEHSIRNGSYLHLWGPSRVPPDPWTGSWTVRDVVRSGVFIDLPDKKGYIAFTQMAKGRIGYDYGGYNWFGSSDNEWFFYDLDTLGAAAKGEIPKKGITPSSFNTVEYPYDAATANGIVSGEGRDGFSHSAAGSYFDHETRRLYLYVGSSMKNSYDLYINPAVHVYRVIEGYKDDDFDDRSSSGNNSPLNPPAKFVGTQGGTKGCVGAIFLLIGVLSGVAARWK